MQARWNTLAIYKSTDLLRHLFLAVAQSKGIKYTIRNYYIEYYWCCHQVTVHTQRGYLQQLLMPVTICYFHFVFLNKTRGSCSVNQMNAYASNFSFICTTVNWIGTAALSLMGNWIIPKSINNFFSQDFHIFTSINAFKNKSLHNHRVMEEVGWRSLMQIFIEKSIKFN